ncbi:regulator of chromosome condensation [Planoprotostelium fungivorum]|uniref:Regulator of chromosome condensation n=1 Tax=Planoprotostelium fungivorum TaxID=1890364 RepID=A0A2P6N3W6_9EUKA|nr:regulator of chromosome condensation [Planoprotostelium fungivorum]
MRFHSLFIIATVLLSIQLIDGVMCLDSSVLTHLAWSLGLSNNQQQEDTDNVEVDLTEDESPTEKKDTEQRLKEILASMEDSPDILQMDMNSFAHQMEGFVDPSVFSLPQQVLNITDVKAICTNGYSTVALTRDGHIIQWGISVEGYQKMSIPYLVTNISCGDYYTTALTETGELWSWGRDGSPLGHGRGVTHRPNYQSKEPARVNGLDDEVIVSFSSGQDHSLACTEEGEVYSWGADTYGQTGQTPGREYKRPALISALSEEKIVKVAAGGFHSLFLSEDGKLFYSGQLNGQGETANCRRVLAEISIETMSCGGDHMLAVSTEGHVYAWGWSEHGQIGVNGTQGEKKIEIPTKVEGLQRVKTVVGAKHGHSLAVYAWGWSEHGQIGVNGTQGEKKIEIPTKIEGLQRVKTVVGAKHGHSLAVTEDGDLFAWGWNEQGQLGLGDTYDRTVPNHVTSLKSVVDVDGGYKHTAVLNDRGEVFAFGDSVYGQLGQQ